MLDCGGPRQDWRDGGNAIIVVGTGAVDARAAGQWSESRAEASRFLGVARWLCTRNCLEIDGPSLDSLAVFKDACATTRSRLEAPSLADKGMSLAVAPGMSLAVAPKPSDAARWTVLRGRSEAALGLPTLPSTLR